MMQKLYVLTRKDLSHGYASVQAGHAVAQWIIEYPSSWKNNTLVYLGVRDEKELNKWIYKVSAAGLNYVAFKEPDLAYQTTSMATLCDGVLFEKLHLL